MARLTLEGLTKIFPGGVKALDEFSLDIGDKEFLAVVGPSGCGKSTLLRMIAGLEEETSGRILLDGKELNGLAPKDRDMAIMFQNYALFPHMTVFENMAFGLKLRGAAKPEIAKRVEETAALLGIGELLARYPGEMSGGQRQRAALGRAILRRPKVFLFDEPLSNLDAKMRAQMRVEISRLHQSLHSTMIFVTHDQVEAMTMGDRVVVLKDGVIQQVADPVTLYDHPANTFVAGFIGSPGMNLFQGEIREENGRNIFAHEAFSLPLTDETLAGIDAKRAEHGSHGGREIILGIRPEGFRALGNDAQGSGTQNSTTAPAAFAGGLERGSGGADGLVAAATLKGSIGVVERLGGQACLYIQSGSISFAARVGSGSWQAGQNIELELPASAVKFFDVSSGRALL